MSEIRVTPLEPTRFSAEVTEGHVRTTHTVTVPPQLLDDLGLSGMDEVEIVRQTFEFLLEREPAAAILEHFSLEQVPSYFPDFYAELRVRLGV